MNMFLKLKNIILLVIFIFISWCSQEIVTVNENRIEIEKGSPIIPFYKGDEDINTDKKEKKEEDSNLPSLEKENTKDFLDQIEKDNIDNNIIIIEKETINDIFQINKISFSSNINNLMVITWDKIKEIKTISIWNNKFIPKFEDWKLYIWITSDLFTNWDYNLFFLLNNWTNIEYSKPISFIFNNSKVNIANITPDILKNDINRNIVLQWNWFSKVISIQLSNNIILKNTNFNIINDNVMSIVIPKNLKVWQYKLNLMDVEWIYKSNLEINIIN